MSSPYGQCSLYLCPRQHDYLPGDIPSFITALQEIAFLSHDIPAEGNGYFTGDKFLDYIAYMGCSPAIQFEPGTDSNNYCHIKIHHYKSAHLIYSKTQTKIPNCLNCRKPLADWPKNNSATMINCSHCHTDLPLQQLNWRKMAGYARLFLEITDIFPKEAIPQQTLLDKLSEITGTDWQYFYSCG